METRVELFGIDTETSLLIPLIESGISAGFPSPALDFMEKRIDLNRSLIKHPNATFFGRVNGTSMKNAGIDHGDLLVIDRSLEPKNGKIAVCCIDGEFTAKRIHVEKSEIWLIPENEAFNPIRLEEGNELLIWGIVIHTIKSF